MATENRGVTIYLPPELEEIFEQYCIDNHISRKSKDCDAAPSLGKGILHYLKNQLLGNGSTNAASTGLKRNDLLQLVKESLTNDGLNVDRMAEIARDEIRQALTPIHDELGTIQSQLAKLTAIAQDDLDPAVVQTYLTRRSEKMALEIEALKANSPVNSLDTDNIEYSSNKV
jgi:type II secretory pathway component PulM